MRTPIPGGFFIVVEGIDGSGKSTAASLMAQYCGERGLACCFSKEPTGVGPGKALRDSMRSGRRTLAEEIALFHEDRREHAARTIRPALDTNAVVIVDRYYWSTAAYQGARGADVAEILKENRSFAPEPDLVLLFDVPAETAHRRIHGRGDSPNHFEEVAHLERAREIFLTVLQDSACGVKLDATQPQRDVWREALAVFLSRAGAKIRASKMDEAEVKSALAQLTL